MVSLLGETEGMKMGQKERERRFESQRPQGGPEGDLSHQMSNKTEVMEGEKESVCVCAEMSIACNALLLCLCQSMILCMPI